MKAIDKQILEIQLEEKAPVFQPALFKSIA
jgi:hypothetical protein